MEVLQTSISTQTILLSFVDDSIIKIEPNPKWSGTEEVEHSIENVAAVRELQEMNEGKEISLLCYLGNTPISKASRDYYKSTPSEAHKVALIATGFFQKLIGSFFMGLSKLQSPTKVFDNEAEALAWLKSKE